MESLSKNKIKIFIDDFNAKIVRLAADDVFYGVVGCYGLGKSNQGRE